MEKEYQNPSELKKKVCILNKLIQRSKNKSVKGYAIGKLEAIGENSMITFSFTEDIEHLDVAIKAFSAMGEYDGYDNLINFVQMMSEQGYKRECLDFCTRYREKYGTPKWVMRDMNRDSPRTLESVYISEVPDKELLRAEKLFDREEREHSPAELLMEKLADYVFF